MTQDTESQMVINLSVYRVAAIYSGLMCRYFQWRTQNFFFWGGSTNSAEDRGQREGDLGVVAP
jgi:hypothetical protein